MSFLLLHSFCKDYIYIMARFSKDELSFVEEVPKVIDIECPVCLNTLSDPHQVTCCGNNFCGSCIERIKTDNGACPMCKEEGYQSFVDKKCLRLINGLQVYCFNQKEGCQWKGELKCLPGHTNRDRREGECLYEVVKCRYDKCQTENQRQHLDDHEKNECPQRPFKCTHCNTKGTHCFITEEHVKNCLKVPTACPNKCTRALMPKDSVPAHLMICRLQPVDCVFSWAGCKERPLRKDIELHTTDTKHMMILAVACGELKKTCDELESENAYTRDLLGVVAADTHPILPIIVTNEREVVNFYTEVGGYHMSAVSISNTIYLAFHEGKFDRLIKLGYPKIYIKDEEDVTNNRTFLKVASYQKISADALVSLSSLKKSESTVQPVQKGIISWHVQLYSKNGYLKSFRIYVTTSNELIVSWVQGLPYDIEASLKTLHN